MVMSISMSEADSCIHFFRIRKWGCGYCLVVFVVSLWKGDLCIVQVVFWYCRGLEEGGLRRLDERGGA